jgi:ABC-2 type transport system ATP-binding protein
MAYTVVAEGISKSFGGERVLDQIDLGVEAGSVLALLGPNGAGKTTMIRILATLIRPDAGTATVAGHDLRSDPIGVKRSISLTGQHSAVDDVLTGRENLEMMAQLLHLPWRPAAQRARDLLAEFDLVDAQDRRVVTYSGGMKRRLDLAIAMIARPPLVFLDEPTTGLDPAARLFTWDRLRELRDDGVTLLLTTHDMHEAAGLADRVGIMDKGKLLALDTPAALMRSLSGETTLELAADKPADGHAFDALKSLPGVERVERLRELQNGAEPLRVRLYLTGEAASLVAPAAALLAGHGLELSDVKLGTPTLEDVFINLTGRSLR